MTPNFSKNYLILLFTAPFLLSAQDQFDLVDVALLTGPSISWMHTDNNTISSDGIQLSYKIHAIADFALNDRFSITAGAGLSLGMGGHLKYQTGGNLWSESTLNIPRGDSLPDGVRLGYGVNYLDFPVGFRMKTNQFGKFRFYAQIPELILGIRTRAKGTIEGEGVNTSKEQIKSQVGFFQLAWALGAGTDFYISDKLTLTGGFRFFQTLSDVTDDSGRYKTGERENSKGYINNIDFRVGIIF